MCQNYLLEAEWNTGSRNPRVMQGKILLAWKSGGLIDFNANSTTIVLGYLGQAPFVWTSHNEQTSMNDLKRSFRYWQYMRLGFMLSRRGEEPLKPAVCSTVRETQHSHPTSSTRHIGLCCQQHPSLLVYLIPLDELPRINRRWAAEHFNESRV